jgi:hypothetical protein
MSGWLPPGVTDADIDRAVQGPDEWPCDWDDEGFCKTCGAGPDDGCEFELDLGPARNCVARRGLVRRGQAGQG